MKKTALLLLSLLALTFSFLSTAQTVTQSEWVYKGADGKLVYRTTAKGDRIMDFSHAGYMGGGVASPNVPVKRTVHPSGADDTDIIQKAIDEVSTLPINKGFRGAVLLAPGIFTCSRSLVINADGVVLRGSGSGNNSQSARTTIKMVGGKHDAIIIGKGQASAGEIGNPQTFLTNTYVPSGTNSITVVNASGFSPGDIISLKRPTTKAWVEFMEMHNLTRDGKPQTWIAENRSEISERKIVSISGNKFVLDIPLSDSFEPAHLNPPGVTVTKIKPAAAVSQAGVEQLHIQCPPLEIAYGQAPYAAIAINGSDIWVTDIYCEETMNSTVLKGKRITLQQVVVTHTYPNLGASKPTDFSIEGTQILIDRCKVTGGNTYFVWTSSLIPGPNVVLNSTFNGHGSRIQPHQRWSTGMLVDNCKVPDGGIDYINRGVAGSGHGWTMGWAVVWNSLAKTFIIQNPPGVMNWAIGCVGGRMQTARLFDTSPILAEGIFDSHGNNVAPQSLYLAQLQERLGTKAVKNIGYSENTARAFVDKSLRELPPLPQDKDPQFGVDLAVFRPVNTNSVRGHGGNAGGEKAVDMNEKTWWTTSEGVTTGTLEVDMEGPVEINTVVVSEAPGMENISQYKIESQTDSDWKLLAEGTTIGDRKVHEFSTVVAWKVKLTVIKASGSPAIRKFGLYRK